MPLQGVSDAREPALSGVPEPRRTHTPGVDEVLDLYDVWVAYGQFFVADAVAELPPGRPGHAVSFDEQAVVVSFMDDVQIHLKVLVSASVSDGVHEVESMRRA